MSTPRTTTVIEDGDEETGELDDLIEVDETEEAQLDALDGMIAEFTGAADTVVNVYRQGDGKNLSFLFRTNPDEMTGGELMEKCRDNYGTGDYRIHIRKGSRLVKNAPFSVEAKKEPDPAILQQQNSGMDMTAIFAMMQENNNRTMQMFTEAMKAFAGQNNNAPTFDPIAAQTAMIQSVATLKGLAEPKDDSKNAVAMLIQGLTLARELGPKDGETNSSDILLEGIKQFAPAIAQATTLGRAARPGKGAALPAPGDEETAGDAARETEMGLRNVLLRQQLGFLVKQAEGGKNPDLYAELLLDQLGETVVLDFLAKDDALAKLVEINPGVAGQQIWFEKLREAILELTAPDTAGDTVTEGEFIPGPGSTDAISDADNDGNIASVAVGDSGNPPDA